MKTSKLMGAELDYWTGRAWGIHPDDLSIIQAQRSVERICVLKSIQRYDPSTSWCLGGPLLGRMIAEGFSIGRSVLSGIVDDAYVCANMRVDGQAEVSGFGDTPLIAACRAKVLSVFGQEVNHV